jgi:hypothetical protein
MNNFMKNILPTISSHPLNPAINNNGGGSISVSMPINVAGNMDSSVIPQIEKIADKVLIQINKAMKQRGYIRQSGLTSI